MLSVPGHGHDRPVEASVGIRHLQRGFQRVDAHILFFIGHMRPGFYPDRRIAGAHAGAAGAAAGFPGAAAVSVRVGAGGFSFAFTLFSVLAVPGIALFLVRVRIRVRAVLFCPAAFRQLFPGIPGLCAFTRFSRPLLRGVFPAVCRVSGVIRRCGAFSLRGAGRAACGGAGTAGRLSAGRRACPGCRRLSVRRGLLAVLGGRPAGFSRVCVFLPGLLFPDVRRVFFLPAVPAVILFLAGGVFRRDRLRQRRLVCLRPLRRRGLLLVGQDAQTVEQLFIGHALPVQRHLRVHRGRDLAVDQLLPGLSRQITDARLPDIHIVVGGQILAADSASFYLQRQGIHIEPAGQFKEIHRRIARGAPVEVKRRPVADIHARSGAFRQPFIRHHRRAVRQQPQIGPVVDVDRRAPVEGAPGFAHIPAAPAAVHRLALFHLFQPDGFAHLVRALAQPGQDAAVRDRGSAVLQRRDLLHAVHPQHQEYTRRRQHKEQRRRHPPVQFCLLEKPLPSLLFHLRHSFYHLIILPAPLPAAA